MKNDIITIERANIIFKKCGFSCYTVEISNTADVLFFSVDDFIDFALSNDIKSLFLSDKFFDPESYIITEDFLNKNEQYYGEYLSEVLKDVSVHNELISSIDFSVPASVSATCMHNGFSYSIIFTNDAYFDKYKLVPPREKLHEIFTNHETAIIKKRDEKIREVENLKNEFRTFLINDPAFLRCTNRSLRNNYLTNFMENNAHGKYALLVDEWTPRGIGVYTREAELFVETAWREIKSHK